MKPEEKKLIEALERAMFEIREQRIALQIQEKTLLDALEILRNKP